MHQRQGYQCKRCLLNVHARCAYEMQACPNRRLSNKSRRIVRKTGAIAKKPALSSTPETPEEEDEGVTATPQEASVIHATAALPTIAVDDDGPADEPQGEEHDGNASDASYYTENSSDEDEGDDEDDAGDTDEGGATTDEGVGFSSQDDLTTTGL